MNIDQMNRSRIKLSPIPREEQDNTVKFSFPSGGESKSKEDSQHDNAGRTPTAYEELNYDDVLSKTGARMENTTLNELMLNPEEEQKDYPSHEAEEVLDAEERGANRLSSSRVQQDDDNPINPIKDFGTKTSRIFADSETSKLNSSAVSQRGIDPFLITNSSVMSTYLYKPQYPPSQSSASGGSNFASQLPSPSKTSSSGANRSTGFRSNGESRPVPVSLLAVPTVGRNAHCRCQP